MVDMEEIEYGCCVMIYVKLDRHITDVPKAMNWLNTKSGLPAYHIDKILSVRVYTDKVTSTTVMLFFDKTINCFEVMQNIKQDDIIEAVCPCGMFVTVTRKLCCDWELSKLMSRVRRDLEQYGSLLRLFRCKIGGIKTGDVETLMFVEHESLVLNKEWQKSNKYKYNVAGFRPTPETRVDQETVEWLWSRYGPEDGPRRQMVTYIVEDDDILVREEVVGNDSN